MIALVVNCSAQHYNLAARKLSDWLTATGFDVRSYDGDPGLWETHADLVCLSVIFSWHAPIAREIALRFRDRTEVWCGGPGMFALANWWRRETGLEVTRGVDARFDHQHSPQGQYKMTFASRGCPVNCSFCIVPRIEGLAQTLDWDFQPAPVLCDNNLSALPVDFQEHIIRRYQETGTRLLDANSGFEPRTFDEGTYHRWTPILRGPWRFAFDETREEDDVRRMMAILRDVPKSRKRVYVLIGNEPIAACYARAQKVIEWGGEPFCQYVLPLNWLGDPATIRPRYDWTWQLGRDFARYYNRYVWRSLPLNQYSNRVNERPPFADRCADCGKVVPSPRSRCAAGCDKRLCDDCYLWHCEIGCVTQWHAHSRKGRASDGAQRTIQQADSIAGIVSNGVQALGMVVNRSQPVCAKRGSAVRRTIPEVACNAS